MAKQDFSKYFFEKSGFVILIDSENQPEKWIFKKIAS